MDAQGMYMLKRIVGGLAKYKFYLGVYNGILGLDPFTPLDEVMQELSNSLHEAATNAIPHTPSNEPEPGRVI